MPLDGKILFRARAALAERRHALEEETARREAEVANRVPEARLLMSEIAATISELASAALTSGGDSGGFDEIRFRNLALQKELRRIIKSAGFPENYLENIRHCKICGDVGFSGSKPCVCLMELYRREQRTELSSLLKAGDERFENFDFTYYDTRPDPDTGIAPREQMKMVYGVCLNYARTFGKTSMNLFLTGEPGLGKTFLAACIARYVAENGLFSVVYDTFPMIFSRMEDERFGRGDENVRAQTRRFRECDLLIADDLGTEMRSAFATAALYELLSARIAGKRRTIITSNLSIEEIRARYSPQIASRVEGEYHILTFCGNDIRVLKKERGGL